MLPAPTLQGTEANLVRAIKAKLQGHAYLAVEDEPIGTVIDMIDILKAALLPSRSTNYYRVELSNLYKRPNEHILDYIARTKDLRQAILDNETRDMSGDFDLRANHRLETEVLEHFTDGLPPHLRMPLRFEDCKNLSDACHALIRIYHHAERDAFRHGTPASTPAFSRKTTEPGGSDDQVSIRCDQYAQPNAPARPEWRGSDVTCHYCKQTGHMKFDCELRRVRNQLTTTGNAAGGLSGPGAAQVAPTRSSTTTQFNQASAPSKAQLIPGLPPSAPGPSKH